MTRTPHTSNAAAAANVHCPDIIVFTALANHDPRNRLQNLHEAKELLQLVIRNVDTAIEIEAAAQRKVA